MYWFTIFAYVFDSVDPCNSSGVVRLLHELSFASGDLLIREDFDA